MYETREWPKISLKLTVIALKEAKIYKMQLPFQNQPHHTYSKDSSKDTQKD
jgi:hypothetical protein